jgi:hypothetical protein
VSRLTNENDRRATAIDLMWEISNGRLTTAWIELVVASRTDAYLRESVSAANDRVTEFIDRSFRELFPRTEGATDFYELIPHIVCLTLEGMALEGMTLNAALTTKILTALKNFKL